MTAPSGGAAGARAAAVIGFLGIALYYIIPFRRLSAGFLTWRSYKKHHRR